MSLSDTALSEAFFSELPNYYRGKVRENYSLPDGRRILIATDRQSAFDRILAEIPYKGQVLTLTSAFWFEQTKDIVANHLIEVIDPNVTLAKNMTPIPLEIVVRGYITGVTDTSAWHAYQQGQRDFDGVRLPDNLQKNAKLETPIITPTTKAESGHDEPVSEANILARKIIIPDRWEEIKAVALSLFGRGQGIADECGLILVDTKYEFGVDENDKLHLIDELHTPDSSRYWEMASYEGRFLQGKEPESFDKEFLRLWLKQQGFKGDGPLPEIPQALIDQMSALYITLFERITGQKLMESDVPPMERIRLALVRKGLMK